MTAVKFSFLNQFEQNLKIIAFRYNLLPGTTMYVV